MSANVVRIDRDAEDLAWAEARMDAFGDVQQTAWSVALDLASNWFEGRGVCRFYPDPRYPDSVRPMTIAMAMRAHRQGLAGLNDLGKDAYANQIANSAQIYLMAGDQYKDVTSKALRPFGSPDKWTPEMVRAELAAVKKRYGSLEFKYVRAVLHPTKMHAPYWSQVITAISTGEHGLDGPTARNIIATAQHWLDQQ